MRVLALDLSLNRTGMAWGTYTWKHGVINIKTDIIETKKVNE